jgi:hypothetical protein
MEINRRKIVHPVGYIILTYYDARSTKHYIFKKKTVLVTYIDTMRLAKVPEDWCGGRGTDIGMSRRSV